MCRHWIAFAIFITSTAFADPSPNRISELETLLLQDCGSCHGMTLKGGLGPNLLSGRLQSLPDEMLVETILQGRPQNAMPPWQGLLTRAEVEWLVQALKQGRYE